MVNGGHAEQEPTMLPGSGAKDKIVGDVVQTVAADGRKEITAGVTAEKFELGGDEGDEVAEQEEDVYSMDVSVESVKRSRSVVKEVASMTMASTASELDMNVLSKMTTTTVINKSASESEVATERVRAEIQASDIAAPRATASSKEDTTDLNESPKLQLENEREVIVVNRASPTPVDGDVLRAVEVLEVLEEATAKTVVAGTEVVGSAALWPNLDANEPPQALKTAEDTDVDMMASRVMKVDEAESLYDLETRMVVTCGTCYTSRGDHEFSPAVMHRESDADQVPSDTKKIWHPFGRTRESRGSRSRLNATMDIVLDSMEPVPESLPPKAKGPEETELAGEIELYESSERAEQARQARLLGLLRGEPQLGKPSVELQNDKKRALEVPSQERQRKLSRKIHTADERKKDEEDVCFICFDGGDLVLCDRRSCPKAYHLSCIGRDAAFFKKKGAWLCGWHFCSVCTKPGSFQCYSCPTAYCGSCIVKAEFLLLRKRKGLCEDCLPIVSMIERNETINGDGVEVDFEDQETYECLFKEYWEDLKRRLSLVMPELDKDGKPMGGNDGMLNRGGSETEDPTENDESDKETDESDHDNPDPGCAVWKKRKSKKNRMGSEKMDEYLEPEDDDEKEGQEEQELLQVVRSQKFESWASEELLDFIEYMKEDPTKPLSRFAVNKLLWSYIKRHKLQDPRKSSQINCDERLKSIFGKESVGQFEMFKHLQIHFPANCSADGKKSKDAQVGDDAMNDDDVVGGDGNEDKFGTGGAKERRRGRRPTDEKFERPNSSEYAAIIPKNMDLIYLRRSLLRDLLDDPEFDNKVADTFVRIRVPGISTKTETTYRLVLVTGTRIGEESYKAGTKITSIVLEILNLQKKEDVTVDLVSNQDFTEEECQRLRQSIKCGFIRALTVGQVEEKAIALREAKVNDWFESEKQRLINLRDRASEKGRKKELRECVEKLQELGSPAFRAAKLQARPEVTADPHMDPGYESDLNEIAPLLGGSQKFRQKLSPIGGLEKGTGIGFRSWDAFDLEESVYSGRKGDLASQRSKSSWEETGRRGYCRVGYEGGRSSERLGVGRGSALGVDGKSPGSDERDRSRVWDKNWERYQSRDQDRSRADGCNWNGNGGRIDVVQWAGEVGDSKYCRGEARAGTTPVFGQSRSELGSTIRESVPSATLSGSVLGYGTRSPSVRSLTTLEKEKIWHYQDPTGMVQGPFTMEQLRKWNTTGLFPVNLTIWKTGEVQENSMLLTDAMAGRFKEELLAALRSMPGDFVAVESPTPRCSSSWGVGDAGHSSSRAEQGQSMSGADWDSRNAVERGGNWARGQSSYGGPSSTGRADDWSSSRSRGDSDIWGSSRKGADGSSWGDSESGKSTYGRSSSGREYDASAPRDGSRSTRVPRGSKKDVPCRFYAKGYCKRGDSCEFWHG